MAEKTIVNNPVINSNKSEKTTVNNFSKPLEINRNKLFVIIIYIVIGLIYTIGICYYVLSKTQLGYVNVSNSVSFYAIDLGTVKSCIKGSDGNIKYFPKGGNKLESLNKVNCFVVSFGINVVRIFYIKIITNIKNANFDFYGDYYGTSEKYTITVRNDKYIIYKFDGGILLSTLCVLNKFNMDLGSVNNFEIYCWNGLPTTKE